MKVKTTELTGAHLDWAVAKCLNEHRYWYGVLPGKAELVKHWSPSTTPSQSVPIIEREKLGTVYNRLTEEWACEHPDGNAMTQRRLISFGPTVLISAMRCYVMSKPGDEVEVPDELL